ncbi:MAG: hypothetical protein AB4062_09470 [Crocosphaera sp.]
MNNIFTQIKTLIQDYNLEEASNLLLELTQKKSSRFHNEILGQKGSLKRVLSEERKSIINPEMIRQEKNRIMYALLDLTDEIENELNTTEKSPFPETLNQETGKINFGQVDQVIIQYTDKGDNILDKAMNQEKVINIGDNNQISAPVLIAETIENSFNTLAESNINNDLKNKLDELLKAITEVSKQVTNSEEIETVEILTEDANNLVQKATDDPKSSRVKIYLKRLEETATSLGKIAAPILTIAKGISTLL